MINIKLYLQTRVLYRCYLTNTRHDERQSLLLPLLLSFDPSFVPFSTHLLFISFRAKIFEQTGVRQLPLLFFFPLFFSRRVERERADPLQILQETERGGRAEVGRRLASSLDNASTKEVIRRGLSPWRCSDSACSRPCYARRRHCLDNLAVILHAVSSVSQPRVYRCFYANQPLSKDGRTDGAEALVCSS